ncbi:MAG: anhydro-N-acetylmuramic acid kinase [Pseudanabaenaceae cyanobacterium SKYGB_i_bin29]|nr:anhydro-N-acetylmuramic acid kinase [Pseudanabaenaceae cyanobacterium SKYG29]MDW8421756.1 anhydro-N-acetylmuramic acid kinase [Pseudanabaenaceae cyanobacterium SKYGB_i_bin29]
MQVLGLISGTSLDGIDSALVAISEGGGKLNWQVIRAATFPYPQHLREMLVAVADGKPITVAELADLDDRVALAFSQVAQVYLEAGETIDVIASHGQTVFHRPPRGNLGYSVQLGRGAVIAQQTGIVTVADFRRADIEAGGEGAPLVPMVDWLLLRDTAKDRVIQNIGGISNLTFLPAGAPVENVIGFDNGPGNVLLDRAAQFLLGTPYDRDGATARGGQIDLALCQAWLEHPFFYLPPPKSTGRELFDQEFLNNCWQQAQARGLSIADFLATLTELTVQGIVTSYQRFLPRLPQEVLVCGGGSRNLYLLARLSHLLHPMVVTTTDVYGIPSDYKEAIAFAVLGYWRMQGRAGNLPQVTGAKRSVGLGEIYFGQRS